MTTPTVNIEYAVVAPFRGDEFIHLAALVCKLAPGKREDELRVGLDLTARSRRRMLAFIRRHMDITQFVPQDPWAYMRCTFTWDDHPVTADDFSRCNTVRGDTWDQNKAITICSGRAARRLLDGIMLDLPLASVHRLLVEVGDISGTVTLHSASGPQRK